MGSKDIKNLCMGYDEKQRALMVYGYTGYIKDDWFAMPAFGRRYHEYGIAAYFCVAQASLSAMVIL